VFNSKPVHPLICTATKFFDNFQWKIAGRPKIHIHKYINAQNDVIRVQKPSSLQLKTKTNKYKKTHILYTILGWVSFTVRWRGIKDTARTDQIFNELAVDNAAETCWLWCYPQPSVTHVIAYNKYLTSHETISTSAGHNQSLDLWNNEVPYFYNTVDDFTFCFSHLLSHLLSPNVELKNPKVK